MTNNELLETLTRAGVSRLEAWYDGSCDEGCLQGLECYGPNEDEVDISNELRGALERVLFDLLCEKRIGWEINDGSYGQVELDVATGFGTFYHTWRVPSEDDFEVGLREVE